MQHSPPRPSGEASALDAAVGGDQAAWNRLVERYSGLLWAVARAHRLGNADAGDAIQTTWLRLIEHRDEIRNPEGIGSWLATTARRECLRTLRRTARCQPSEEIEDLVEPDLGGLDAGLLREERDARLWNAFQRLSHSDQALLRALTADPPPSYAQISAALGMPMGSIGPTRGRVLERLRRELRAAGELDLAAEGPR